MSEAVQFLLGLCQVRENPFFWRRLRADTRRRELLRDCAIVIFLFLCATVALLLFHRWAPRGLARYWADVLLYGFTGLHVWTAYFVANARSRETLHVEEARGTLDFVALCPISPPRMMGMRATYPMLFSLATFVPALPVYAFLLGLGLLSPGDLAGLMVVVALISVRPTGSERRRLNKPGAAEQAQSRRALARSMAQICAAVLVLDLLILPALSPKVAASVGPIVLTGPLWASRMLFAPVSFYWLRIPPALWLVLLPLAWGGAAAAQHERVVQKPGEYPSAGRAARLAFSGAALFVLVGFLWQPCIVSAAARLGSAPYALRLALPTTPSDAFAVLIVALALGMAVESLLARAAPLGPLLAWREGVVARATAFSAELFCVGEALASYLAGVAVLALCWAAGAGWQAGIDPRALVGAVVWGMLAVGVCAALGRLLAAAERASQRASVLAVVLTLAIFAAPLVALLTPLIPKSAAAAVCPLVGLAGELSRVGELLARAISYRPEVWAVTQFSLLLVLSGAAATVALSGAAAGARAPAEVVPCAALMRSRHPIEWITSNPIALRILRARRWRTYHTAVGFFALLAFCGALALGIWKAPLLVSLTSHVGLYDANLPAKDKAAAATFIVILTGLWLVALVASGMLTSDVVPTERRQETFSQALLTTLDSRQFFWGYFAAAAYLGALPMLLSIPFGVAIIVWSPLPQTALLVLGGYLFFVIELFFITSMGVHAGFTLRRPGGAHVAYLALLAIELPRLVLFIALMLRNPERHAVFLYSPYTWLILLAEVAFAWLYVKWGERQVALIRQRDIEAEPHARPALPAAR